MIVSFCSERDKEEEEEWGLSYPTAVVFHRSIQLWRGEKKKERMEEESNGIYNVRQKSTVSVEEEEKEADLQWRQKGFSILLFLVAAAAYACLTELFFLTGSAVDKLVFLDNQE